MLRLKGGIPCVLARVQLHSPMKEALQPELLS